MAISFKVFHTTQHRGTKLETPIFAEGPHNWFGDGYYFWKDIEFAEHWGFFRCCKKDGKVYKKFDIYSANLEVDSEENVIDTVFNEDDYYNFLNIIETFAAKYYNKFFIKPTLEQFNDFISDFNIWKDIKLIRFQDLPTNDRFKYLKIKGFFYKKRIVYVVFDLNIIHNFAPLKTISCN